jgi:hypothetical protein
MSAQDRVTILFTLVVGFFAGVYLYLTGFATTFEPPEVSTNNIYEGFVITAESYGVCSEFEDCLSFQVLENGMFRAILKDGEEEFVKEARIPLSMRRELKSALTAVVLERESVTVTKDCRFEEDNYRFSITRDGESYVLDTCKTAINYDGVAWQNLSLLWNHVASLDW